MTMFLNELGSLNDAWKELRQADTCVIWAHIESAQVHEEVLLQIQRVKGEDLRIRCGFW